MKTSTQTTEKSGIIVAFHTGRGGRFHNAGHKSFIGEKNFQDLIRLNDSNLFLHNRDAKGRFCKPFLADLNGTQVTESDINGLTGYLDFDGQYDYDGCDHIEDCTDEEIRLIAESSEYKSSQLIMWLENYDGSLKFDKYGQLIEEEVEA